MEEAVLLSNATKPVVGPCGLVCNLCRRYIDHVCQGCAPGDRCSPEHATGSSCMIVRCAAARGVSHCMRDCPDFPCLLYTTGRLYCQTTAVAHDRQVPFPVVGRGQAAAASESRVPEAGVGQPFRLYTLGRFRLFLGDRELDDKDWGKVRGPTGKMQALLVFLVFQGQRGARRDLLLDTLWPDQTKVEQAAASLHFAVNRLRCLLEPDRPAFGRSSVIDFDGLRYCFMPRHAVWVDVDAFEQHGRAAAQARHVGDELGAAAQWRLAVSLYHGDFLAGLRAAFANDDFQDWCTLRREALREQYQAALLALGEHHFRLGDLDAGAQLAQQVLQEEPETEAARELLRRCLLSASATAPASCSATSRTGAPSAARSATREPAS